MRWTGMDFDSLCTQLCVAGLTSSLRFRENHSLLNPVYVVFDRDRQAHALATPIFCTLIWSDIVVMPMQRGSEQCRSLVHKMKTSKCSY